MQQPPVPDNESERLQRLRDLGVLDTPPEDRFDRVTRLAKRLFGVPIVLVSLVDANRQWFKSCIGLDATETSREISFCGHAILGDGLFLVSDTLNDPRFSDNPLVLNEPNIRFYAGQPLRVQGNTKIGTLCLIDRVPREFTDDDRHALRDLAGMVEKELIATQMATVDELTQLTNRRGLLSLGQNTMNLVRRINSPAIVFVFDLDGFKQINDTFGHEEGDSALKAFASILIDTFRDADVVARLGGDEFVTLMANCPVAAADGIIARLSSMIDDHNEHSGKKYKIKFSVGRVLFDKDRHLNINVMIADADAAMYQAKLKRKKSNSTAS